MKRYVSFLLSAAIVLSVLLMPASAINITTKSQLPEKLDFAVGIGKWITHLFTPISINEGCALYVYNRLSVSFNIEDAPFSHASTLLKLPDGSLICAWFGGDSEGAQDTRIWYSIKNPKGLWSEPKKIVDSFDCAHWNPVLYLTEEGNVRLYYKSTGGPQEWYSYYCESSDGGFTWTEPKEVSFESETGLSAGGPVKNKCFKTSEGLLLAPNSYETDEVRRAVIEYSTDDGLTWQDNGEIIGYNDEGVEVKIIQPSIWEGDDGTLHALMRSKDNFIYRSDSYDGGKTWCDAYRTGMLNNNSGLDLVKTDDGLVWLVCNASYSVRSPLTLYVSYDDGDTFCSVKEIVNILPIEFSYPAIIADGNTLYISYTNMRMGISCVTLKYSTCTASLIKRLVSLF